MKKTLLIIFSALATTASFAQIYTPQEASDHIGDSVTVCGRIFGGRFLRPQKVAQPS
jgi:hypothetical protein